MDVTLIDYTGFGHPDPLFAARKLAYLKNTRLEMSPAGWARYAAMPEDELMGEVEYVANTIRSSWEFIKYTFQITGVTRAFTHQFVRTRVGVSFAQQAQRVVNMGDFEALMPETVAAVPGGKEIWNQVMHSIGGGYKTLSAMGVPNQDCRGLLPTNVLTNIAAEFNLRSMADLVGKRQNARAQGEYADVAAQMADRIVEVHPWTQKFLYPERTATPKLDKLLRDALGDRAPIDAPEVNSALKELDTLKGTWG